jgi:hypothetical protein
MTVHKMAFTLAISLFLLTGQAVAREQVQAGASGSEAEESDDGGGIVKSIDFAMNKIVISDVVYGYSPGRLIVRKGGKRVLGATSLQPNQVVHFICAPRKPGNNLSATRTITEIWIDEK